MRKKFKKYDDLTAEDIKEIESLLNIGVRVKDILEKININQNTLDKIFENGFTSVYLKKINNQKQKK
ncbi:MAG: hypothetical protein Unbinned2716contig1000_38 [Prokaryotic dsDNA virus sp.]|mgnify:CR=1 FL=1|nr:MAG: hypothetical protein Unbinned2716contig1000_38 [Prokaryotic dsDNA virus sp.]|tara:strand:+ start:10543 stop:10743 length:201 start_codon:yes stop_codon:yes gene_type:complete